MLSGALGRMAGRLGHNLPVIPMQWKCGGPVAGLIFLQYRLIPRLAFVLLPRAVLQPLHGFV